MVQRLEKSAVNITLSKLHLNNETTSFRTTKKIVLKQYETRIAADTCLKGPTEERIVKWPVAMSGN